MTTPADARPDRYGRAPRRLRRRGWLLAVAGALTVGIGWAAWVAWSDAGEKVAWTTIGFTVVDDASTRVSFQVDRDPQRVVVCTVRALNAGFAEVGLVDVTVPAGRPRTVPARATIPTSERAVTGVVKDCAVQP